MNSILYSELSGQQLAQFHKELPDPAPEPAAASEKEPEPLQDQVQVILKNLAGEADGDGHAAHENELHETVDRDDMIAMVVDAENSKLSRCKPPPSFMHREAYVALLKKDLVDLPFLPGAGIFYHSTSQQWHGAWDGGNRAPKWGPDLRSETEALLIALIAVWERYLVLNPDDESAKLHVKKLQDELAQAS